MTSGYTNSGGVVTNLHREIDITPGDGAATTTRMTCDIGEYWGFGMEE